jgi:phospholipid/cholesterol/gamma-HCH transport system ATP-binding protein
MIPLIELRDIWLYFDKTPVLTGLNLSVYEYETLAIFGPSGAGKTVLLKTILGFIKPDSGKVEYNGIDITKLSESEIATLRKDFGMVFQNSALFDWLTIYDNIALPLEEQGLLTKYEIRNKVEEVLSAVGLENVESLYPNELSGGMQKRAAIARTLALSPRIVIYDEPTTGLDPILSASIIELIKQTNEKFKTTCIIVSHDIRNTIKISNRCAFLYSGRILKVCKINELFKAEEYIVKKFLVGAGLNEGRV